jgi:class 3 adenylate cyclase/tetratricopeptide (TPR) repeat protein
VLICGSCGRENPDGFSFCGFCTAQLAPTEPSKEVRKTVTLVFCDVTGSTAMGESLDPEAVRRVMGRYFEEMRTVLESHGGTVEKFIGDAVMAVFGIPQVHEDDALRAVRAALDMRERLRELNEELERDFGVTISARTGVSTGEVVVGSAGQTLATGDPVNVAARLEQAAQPWEILLGEATHRLVRDAVLAEPVEPLELKGKAERLPAFRLSSVAGDLGVARRFDTPLVGRLEELQVLRDALARAVRDRACVLVSVLGPAGIGKSRLIQEFLHGVDASVLAGRCLPYGDGITYWPVVEMLTASAGISNRDDPGSVRDKLRSLAGEGPDAEIVVERIGHLIGLEGTTAVPEETHWAVRKLLQAMARGRPVVVVVEDLHWAEPALLDLIEHVADLARDAPILLVCPARPELLDERPGWGGGKLNATSFLLEPLSETETEQLLANLLGHGDLPQAVRSRITDAAEGNPLFVEQMVGMLIDDGILEDREGAWILVGDEGRVAVPASIKALVEARIERLPEPERTTMQLASVEGKVFHLGAVRALSADGTAVERHVTALVRRDLIRPDESFFAGDDAFRFRSLVIRDAAYVRMSKETRADLHERYAGWLERAAGDRAAEFDEIVGYHLEQAYLLRAELGPVDDVAEHLADRAADRLVACGARAMDRGDMAAAVNLLSRAARLLPADSTRRLDVLIDIGWALGETGRFEEARATLMEAIDAARAQGAKVAEARARLRLLPVTSATDPSVRMEDGLTEAETILAQVEPLGDDRALAEAWSAVGLFRAWLGRSADAEVALERAVAAARRCGDRRSQTSSQALRGTAVAGGPTPADRAVEALEELRSASAGMRPAESLILACQAHLEAMRGNAELSRAHARAAVTMLEDLGHRVQAAGQWMFIGISELVLGDLVAAERKLRTGCDELQELGETGYLSTMAAYLALALVLEGKVAEADRFGRLSEEAAAVDDLISTMYWRIARARVLAARGEPGEAEDLARDAVGIAEATDWLFDQGQALWALGDVLQAAGRPQEAREAFEQALDRFERKGDVMDATRMREALAGLDG